MTVVVTNSLDRSVSTWPGAPTPGHLAYLRSRFAEKDPKRIMELEHEMFRGQLTEGFTWNSSSDGTVFARHTGDRSAEVARVFCQPPACE